MDIWSRVSSSSDSSVDTSSSATSAAYPVEPINGGADVSSDEVSSHALQDIRAKIFWPKLVPKSRKYTLFERSNQLSRMMGELKSKDYQLALKDR